MSNLNIKMENHNDELKQDGPYLTVYSTKASKNPSKLNSYVLARPNVFSLPTHIAGNCVGRFRGTGRVEQIIVDGITEDSLVQVRLVGFTKEAMQTGIEEPVIEIKPFGFTHHSTMGALYLYTVYFA